ncbi:MAG: antibiotic biosynthesis monooxygenase family protein [Phaeodactylibacter sp.]|uniref:putative quinol monooxygenase n=1 Tax=Phaeodactylibacter sp. TaxID=1940289 RepID=UPI0032EE3894
MIKRIVKLTFQPEKTDDFRAIFENSKALIRSFPGCHHLELWCNKNQPEVFFTYSYWEDEAALDRYRHSDLFKRTWAQTKVLFGGKPEAWSVEVIAEVD